MTLLGTRRGSAGGDTPDEKRNKRTQEGADALHEAGFGMVQATADSFFNRR
jgi:hypothetical protein